MENIGWTRTKLTSRITIRWLWLVLRFIGRVAWSILWAVLRCVGRLFQLTFTSGMKPGNYRKFLPAIPDDQHIYCARLIVAGTSYQLPRSARWCCGHGLRLWLRPEPRNKHDANAVRVIGVKKGLFFERHTMIGHVDRDTAHTIAMFTKISQAKFTARLRYVWLGDDGQTMTIEFDLLGPKMDHDVFKNL